MSDTDRKALLGILKDRIPEPEDPVLIDAAFALVDLVLSDIGRIADALETIAKIEIAKQRDAERLTRG